MLWHFALQGIVFDYAPFFLLDAARELTDFFRTLVVPDQTSYATTWWGSKHRGPITVYRFKLIDKPLTLRA